MPGIAKFWYLVLIAMFPIKAQVISYGISYGKPATSATSRSNPSQVKPNLSQAKPSPSSKSREKVTPSRGKQAKPSQAKPSQAKPSQAKS